MNFPIITIYYFNHHKFLYLINKKYIFRSYFNITYIKYIKIKNMQIILKIKINNFPIITIYYFNYHKFLYLINKIYIFRSYFNIIYIKYIKFYKDKKYANNFKN